MRKVLIGIAVLVLIGVGFIVSRPAVTQTLGCYLISGGTSCRTDAIRWTDNGLNVADAGIDCTGTADSTTALQNAVNAIPDGSNLWFPIGCHAKISSTITIRSRANIGFRSAAPAGIGACEGSVPQIIWAANGGTVFDFEYVDTPWVDGLYFTTTGYIDTVLNFDRSGSNPNAKTGTAGHITNSCFYNNAASTPDFTAVYISPTTTSNEENFVVDNIVVNCSTSQAVVRARDGVTNGTTTLTSATAAFVAGDVGATIFVTYPRYFLQTTIASVTNATTVVLSAPTTGFTQSNVQISIGQGYGYGIHVGASQNAIQHQFRNINYSNCDKGIYMENGSADIYNINGGSSDWGIYATNSAGSIRIDSYASEDDMRAVELVAPTYPVWISNSRLSNAHQMADGFIKFGATVTAIFINSGGLSRIPTNGQQVLIGFAGNPILTSIGNNFTGSSNLTWAQIGYSLNATPVTTLNDYFDTTGGFGPHNFGCYASNVGHETTNCVTIASNWGHQHGNGLTFNSVNFFSDATYSETDMVAPTAPIQTSEIYNAAGNALPSCVAALKGSRAVVSDATSPTYLGVYTSGGAVIAPVFCNGSGWVTN